jgi:transposase-like protein
MDPPGRRRSGLGAVRHRAGPLREAGPVECATSRSGKPRVPSPAPLGQARSGERNRNSEAQHVDCVRIVHKTANVLDKLPRSVQPAAKADLREIWQAPDRATADAAIATFAGKYAAKYDKAVACLLKDRGALLTFYAFPAEHWDHLRTANPIESVFATVRHRTVRTKGALSQDTARLMVFKLVMAAAKTWRRLKGETQLPKVIQGVTFRDGVEVTDTPAQTAA